MKNQDVLINSTGTGTLGRVNIFTKDKENEISSEGHIAINGKKAKPSSTLKVGDRITIYFAKKEVDYEVLELKDSTKKEDATKMFKILSEKSREVENERTE